jgi:probable phosphoglycerate mutase
MTAPTTIHLIRHGDVHNPAQILYGRKPGYRLSDLGLQQAAAAGEYLKDRPLAAIFSSPQLRAQQTAAAVARFHPELHIQVTPLLDEIYSPHEGRLLADLDAEGWKIYTGLPAGYETAEDVVGRVVALIEQLRRDYAGQEVAAVSHGDNVLSARFWASGIPFSDDTKNRVDLYPATASITTLTFANGASRPDMSYCRPY